MGNATMDKQAGRKRTTRDSDQQKDAGEQWYSGTTVRRERLLREIGGKGAESGIVLVVAPEGFGKSTLLMQYGHAVEAERDRKGVMLVDGSDLDIQELLQHLDLSADALPWELRPLILVDGIGHLTRGEAGRLASALRALRNRGAEVVVACTPANRALVDELSDAGRIGAQSLTVQPSEYSEWVSVFSIAQTLDVYGLTEGIPCLVAALQAVTDRYGSEGPLEDGIIQLYGQVIDELRHDRDPIYRIVSMMVLMGSGAFGELSKSGLKIREETVARLRRDYPMFGMEQQEGGFSCLTTKVSALAKLRKKIAARKPGYAAQAARALVRSGRVDDAVALAQLVLNKDERLEIVVQYPLRFALAGHGAFVNSVLATAGLTISTGIESGALVAAYVSALTLGDYRLARSAAIELRRRSSAIAQELSDEDWACVRAVSEVWDSVSGIGLPDIPERPGARTSSTSAMLLRAHASQYAELVGRSGDISWKEQSKLLETPARPVEVDIPLLLLRCDRYLDDILHGRGIGAPAREELERLVETLVSRRLTPIAARVRMVVNLSRLFAGEPVVDERGFVDAGTTAVRESDLSTQLLCLAAEGWQGLVVGQAVNAQFRGQQVIKLSGDQQTFLISWANLLECVGHLRCTSRVKIREEAESLDLSEEGCDAARAWSVALHLSAARFDSELSAWYSLHKGAMLEKRFLPAARLAMTMLGNRADSMRRLLPRSAAVRSIQGVECAPVSETLFEVIPGGMLPETGQVLINLFGGFHIERNGHALTEGIWRRKKASVLAARLVLTLGTFVSRRTIIDELWPEAEYHRGRESLYVTLSALRSALGQRNGGPQYILTQGEGLALNGEYVYSDTKRFDGLAREVLLGSDAMPTQQVVETCLKIEQLYRGPLYIPDSGSPAFFTNARRAYQTRFIDCMVRGIDAAIELENLSSAAWLVEAALRQAPTREDVIRRAMTVFDLNGRRREVVELYNSHLHYLERELNTLPEEETREAYDRIINRAKRAVML